MPRQGRRCFEECKMSPSDWPQTAANPSIRLQLIPPNSTHFASAPPLHLCCLSTSGHETTKHLFVTAKWARPVNSTAREPLTLVHQNKQSPVEQVGSRQVRTMKSEHKGGCFHTSCVDNWIHWRLFKKSLQRSSFRDILIRCVPYKYQISLLRSAIDKRSFHLLIIGHRSPDTDELGCSLIALYQIKVLVNNVLTEVLRGNMLSVLFLSGRSRRSLCTLPTCNKRPYRSSSLRPFCVKWETN